MAGGEGGSDGSASVAAMCLVCGTNQANLTQHLSRHSKEEIIRAVTHGRPLPELATRRPPGRPRRPSFPPLPATSVSPVLPRPPATTTTQAAPLLLPANPQQQQQQQQAVATPLASLPHAAPPPHLAATPPHPVKLSSISPILQPPRNAVPLAATPVQPCPPGSNYLLIGNNVFPAGSVLPNNLQLGNNGVSYLIPSSGGLVLATAPSASQTLLVQAPTPTSQPVTVKPQPPPTPVSIASNGSMVGNIYNNIPRQPFRPPVPESPVCYIEKTSTFLQDEMPPTPVPTPMKMETSPLENVSPNNTLNFMRPILSHDNGPQKATINIGQNISISLPRDLVEQKERLKDIINQELVRALLMNETQKNSESQSQQPSTSSSSAVNRSDIYSTKNEPANLDMKSNISATQSEVDDSRSDCVEENSLSIDSEFCDEDNDIDIDEKQQYIEENHEQDPLAILTVPVPTSKCQSDIEYHDSSSSIHVDPNVPLPARTITIESDVDGTLFHPYNIPVDQPMEVVFSDKPSCSRPSSDVRTTTSHSGLSIQNDIVCYTRDNSCSKLPSVITTTSLSEPNRGMEVKQSQLQQPGRPGTSTVNIVTAHSSAITVSQASNPVMSPCTGKQTANQPGQDHILSCNGDQPLTFLTSDRTFNTLLGNSSLQEMVYVEEQVLGAVEEVFSGEQPSSLPSTSSAVNGMLNQKSPRKVNASNSYINVYDQQCSSSSLSQHQQQENQTVKMEVKCKIEPQGSSTQPISSNVNRTVHQANHLPPNHSMIRSRVHIGGKVEPATQEQEEEMVDDPSLSDEFGNETIFPDDHMFERELSNQQTEEVMSLKASETLADSDSERATPHEELSDLMFYDRSCMFAGEPGPANLSPRTYPTMDSSAFHPLAPAIITPLENTVQIETGQSMGSLGHTEVVELNANESTMHISTDMLPPDGLSITQLFPPMPQTDPLATDSSTPTPSSSSSSKVGVDCMKEEMKFSSKVTVLETSCCSTGTINRQLSPVPSTSGLQGSKSTKEDEDYEFEYESDCYGDSDSDNCITSRGPLDLDHWKCLVCNKMFKSLKEKLLHAGQHSPCAEAMEKSGAIRSAIEVKCFQSSNKQEIEAETARAILKCKEEMGTLQDETRTMLESFSSNGEYKCPECRLRFPSAETLFEHRKMVFKSRVTCQKRNWPGIKKHMRDGPKNANTVENVLCTSRASQSTSARSMIHSTTRKMLHVREHSGDKQHKCMFCGKAFFRKYNLDNHVRIHTGEMPYECTICRKDFTQKSNYNVHMKAFHVERHAVHEEL
ncbi:hypothetical protein Pmani_027751 [Petrolisthes manimaculis]|uniref:C2H2-type domain-containing protein n=1 Tax=Petrolisthes manimaculis TaxID=1843537 RepID=A0AAE1P0Q8_9EUCA|nr:hypothetical protein Pmani_027751 [Petrolisthes manimaculis]